MLAFGADIVQAGLLVAGIVLGSFSFSALRLIFGSIPARDPGTVQMPSTLLRWGLPFISGVFIPLADMAPLARIGEGVIRRRPVCSLSLQHLAPMA